MLSSVGGIRGFTSVRGSGSRFRIASRITAGDDPPKAFLAVPISYSTMPSENRSLRASTASPRACSGDMYAMVPTASPGLVKFAAVVASSTLAAPKALRLFANPKSRILTCSS